MLHDRTVYVLLTLQARRHTEQLAWGREVVEHHGLFCSLYTDRGRHCWHTPEAGGKVDQANPTPFGRAMALPVAGRAVGHREDSRVFA